MKQSTLIVIIIGICLFVGGVVFYTDFQQPLLIDKEDHSFEFENDYRKAIISLNSAEYTKALKIIEKHQIEILNKRVGWEKWISLFIEISAQTKDVKQLCYLYSEFQNFFYNNEKASLLLAEEFIFLGKKDGYNSLRKLWLNRETKKFNWIVLDSDYLTLEGRREQAIQLLVKNEFVGQEETDRLLRLYSMHVHDQPEVAMDFLNEAWNKNRGDSTLLCMRAKIFETMGNRLEAFSDYILAASLFPDDINVKEEFANFLIRIKKYIPALKLIEKTINDGEVSNKLLLNLFFWGKMVQPQSISLQNLEISEDINKPIIEYISQLKPHQFWNNFFFNKAKNKSNTIASSQEIFWLQLIEELKLGNEVLAQELLIQNIFKEKSWDFKLEKVLSKIIQIRRGELSDSQMIAFEAIDFSNLPLSDYMQIIDELGEISIKDDYLVSDNSLLDFLNGPLAYSTAFLAAGWNNVAIELLPKNYSFDNVPPQLLVAFANAVRNSFGDSQALAFLKHKPKYPEVDLLVGEIYFEQNKPELALVRLKKLSEREDQIGSRALWIQSLIYLQENNLYEAKEIVFENPQLKNHALGIDSLARLAVAEGQNSKAKQLFRSIENESVEAQSFLSRIAFSEGKFEKAKELTLKVLDKYSDNETLQNNLIKIIKAQELGMISSGVSTDKYHQ